MTYDVAHGAVILFGGSMGRRSSTTLNDLWQFQGDSWEPLRVQGGPPTAVDRTAMVCDSGRGFSVVFGGQHNSWRGWPMQNETWILDNRRWRKARGMFRTRPAPRCGHSMAYDETAKAIVLFGGARDIYRSRGDTWTFDGGAWHKVKSPSPPARRYAQFGWDGNLGGCVLYGGSADDFGEFPFNDCWLFKDNEWHFLEYASGGAPRDDCGAWFHKGAGRFVMLSGKDTEPDILTLESDGWRVADCASWLPPRQCYGSAYDPRRDAIVVYGGEEGHEGARYSDTFLLTLC